MKIIKVNEREVKVTSVSVVEWRELDERDMLSQNTTIEMNKKQVSSFSLSLALSRDGKTAATVGGREEKRKRE